RAASEVPRAGRRARRDLGAAPRPERAVGRDEGLRELAAQRQRQAREGAARRGAVAGQGPVTFVIAQVQAQLEAIYGVKLGFDVASFLVDDVEAARALGGSGRAREELLVSEVAGGDLELALFISREVLSKLRRYERRPALALDRELGSYCEVAEA